MAVFISLVAILALGSVAYVVSPGASSLFGIYIPYVALIVFVCGFAAKVIGWAKTPVPFSIPTTAGQMKSFDWIKSNPIDNPATPGMTVVRMLLEVLTFRTLFRNKSVAIHPGPRVTYSTALFLWLFALLFHYCFLVIVLRHLRFFFEPVPMFVGLIEFFDGLFQIGVPRLYQTDVIIVAAVLFLFGRRIFNDRVRYISLLSDYFPLFLILGICGTGIWMRYFGKTDIAAVKVLTMGLVTLHPVIPEGVGPIFYTHLFLVSILLIYFPFSKLMHAGGVFLSPTRNLPNNSRAVHYENPWNPPKKFHTYEAYEDDFREPMIECGLPVDKTSAETPAE